MSQAIHGEAPVVRSFYVPGVRVPVKTTPRTWMLVLLALLISGVIAWREVNHRRGRGPLEPRSAEPSAHRPSPGGSYTFEIELEE